MPKTRSRIADLSVYLVLRVMAAALLMLPLTWSLGLVRWLAWLAHGIDRRHREVAAENLRRAFPGRYSEAQIARLVREVYEHFGVMFLEMALFPRKLRRSTWRRRIAIEDPDLWQMLLTCRRPIMLVTAHYGNWELSAYWPGMFGIRGHMVARPIDNPYLDRVVTKHRELTGGVVLSKNGDAAEMRDVLARGGAVFTIGDQDAGARGMFVEFFGRPASTHKAIAVLALRSKALMVIGGMQRTGGVLEYTLRTTDLIRPEEYAGVPDAVRAVTQRMTTSLERLVRHDPRQYFWLHRRWKHQPPVQADRAA
mgnify:CR=1 FL=1